MPVNIQDVRYQKGSPERMPEYVASHDWGTFIRYLEFGNDCFATRQVDAYENGYLARYDREHWYDQFGSLADFRFGDLWIKHWGQHYVITREDFELKWNEADSSPSISLRNPSPTKPPPWIELFESGRWPGQA